jgi:hypothetical protein
MKRHDSSLQRVELTPSTSLVREHGSMAITKAEDRLCASVYRPPEAETGWTLESLLGGRACRYFSFGRRALAAALRLAGVGAGDAVALPSFICRDVLAALHACGAVPCFYEVGEDLGLAGRVGSLPSCAAVIAVNYFGFPQALAPFRDYCRRTGAVLIEDNAHGLFSRDEEGTLLGIRGDIGIFSLRKTLPLPNGAALVVNDTARGFTPASQEPFETGPASMRVQLKQWVRHAVPVIGPRFLHRFLELTRRLDMNGNAQAEQSLPEPACPCAALSRPLKADIAQETARRRALYGWVAGRLREAGLSLTPVFPDLPDWVVPYGYPFYAHRGEFVKARAVLGAWGLDCVTWPDLPDAVRRNAGVHYTTLRFVSFLW